MTGGRGDGGAAACGPVEGGAAHVPGGGVGAGGAGAADGAGGGATGGAAAPSGWAATWPKGGRRAGRLPTWLNSRSARRGASTRASSTKPTTMSPAPIRNCQLMASSVGGGRRPGYSGRAVHPERTRDAARRLRRNRLRSKVRTPRRWEAHHGGTTVASHPRPLARLHPPSSTPSSTATTGPAGPPHPGRVTAIRRRRRQALPAAGEVDLPAAGGSTGPRRRRSVPAPGSGSAVGLSWTTTGGGSRPSGGEECADVDGS